MAISYLTEQDDKDPCGFYAYLIHSMLQNEGVSYSQFSPLHDAAFVRRYIANFKKRGAKITYKNSTYKMEA